MHSLWFPWCHMFERFIVYMYMYLLHCVCVKPALPILRSYCDDYKLRQVNKNFPNWHKKCIRQWHFWRFYIYDTMMESIINLATIVRRANVWLKWYPLKQCSSAHNHHQSCHCITFAKPSLSCLLYFLYSFRRHLKTHYFPAAFNTP